jgi:hypothetical protein
LLAVDAHDLYGLPLDRFVPERTALAKELRQAGERDQAKGVAALRKPSRAAWAVNQLVRTQSRALATLFEAGDAVRLAQAELIAGRGDSDALRETLNRERQAVADLVRVARGLLSSEGHELSPATLERVSETLDAAALEDEARANVQDGCLHRELRRVGLGADLGSERPAPEPRASKRKGNDLGALRRAEAVARRAAERAARDLKAAQAKRDAAAEVLEAADAALAEAAEHARHADAAHHEAEKKLRSRR